MKTKFRTVYSKNAIGAFISREQAVQVGGGFCWVEVERQYDFELLFYPTSLQTRPDPS